MIAKADVLKKVLTPIAVGLIAAFSVMLAFGVSPVQGDQVTGRAVIGTITAVGTDTVTVSTAQGDFILKLAEGTRISAPRIRNANVDHLTANKGGRVAILADRKLVNEDGTPADQATAVKISIIPSKATRSHRRVVVTEKRGESKGTTVDAEGNSTELRGIEESGADAGGAQLGLPEAGESAVLLVRPGAGEDQKDEITAVIKTRSVIERLNRLAERLKTQNEDAFQSARIERLLDKHREAVAKRLENARAKAEERFKEVIERAAERAAKALKRTRETRGAVSGLDEEKSECVRRILGRLPASKADIPPGQLQRIEVQCLRDKDGATKLKLTSPRPGTTLTEGEEVEIRFETGELGEVVIQLLINDEVQPLDTVTGNTQGLRFRVPVGESILSIELLGSRPGADSETFLKMLYDVRRDPPPRLGITAIGVGREVAPGSTIILGAQAEDNGEVVSITLAVNGVALHSATGTALLSGVAYTVPAGAASLEVVASATDNLGNTTTVIRTIGVVGDPEPQVEIVSPAEGAVLIAGTDFNIDVQADDNDQVVSVSGILTTGSATSRLVFAPTSLALPGMDWRAVATVPVGTISVKVEVTATDSAGNTATAGRDWTVRDAADAPPSVKIVSPRDGSSVEEGSALTVEIEATDDVRITGAEINWPIIGEMASARPSGGLWVAQTTVPTISSTTVALPNTTYPPHVFVGQVTIGGVSAATGTVVTAWIDGSSTSRITLEAMATDNGGNTSTTSISLEVLGQQVLVGEATVSDDGNYALNVSALQGQNFAGKTIRFRVGGVAVSPIGFWEQGGGTELPLGR